MAQIQRPQESSAADFLCFRRRLGVATAVRRLRQLQRHVASGNDDKNLATRPLLSLLPHVLTSSNSESGSVASRGDESGDAVQMAPAFGTRFDLDPLCERTVGVVARDDARVSPGYTLFTPFSRDTYLVDLDGRVVHSWVGSRSSAMVYLLPNGHLLRDGSEDTANTLFRAGGAAGHVEVVTWDNEPVWSFSYQPYDAHLTHHDMEPLPNGNVLLLAWERVSKEQMLQAGRRPELIPDGEVWEDHLIELQPDGHGGAVVVWEWRLFDHVVQDFDATKDNFGDPAAEYHKLDLNYSPANPRGGNRNGSDTMPRGTKDFTHANAVSYNPHTDQIMISYNFISTMLVIDHSTTTEEAAGSTGGRWGRGGDILYRFGNPAAYRDTDFDGQALFNQHNTHWLPSYPATAVADTTQQPFHFLVFNNGRQPDRWWSSVDEWRMPPLSVYEPDDAEGGSVRSAPPRPCELVWSFGPKREHLGSFFSTHISGCQRYAAVGAPATCRASELCIGIAADSRLPNGNTLITQGPEGIVFEVTSDGDEVWRFINPIISESALIRPSWHFTPLLC